MLISSESSGNYLMKAEAGECIFLKTKVIKNMSQDKTINLIHKKLTQSLSPTELEIVDDSHLHIGHPGAKSGGGHFTIIISAEIFKNKSRIESHRLIYDALGDLIGKEIHALQIKIKK
jgi:BolA protein